MKKPLLIAHRCGPSVYPEQTIQSARLALEQGADMVEMDVYYTSDDVPVICHDPNTLRCFGLDARVSDLPYEKFMTLRHTADRAYPAHSLQDVIDCGVAPILLHCKNLGKRQTVEKMKVLGDKVILGVQGTADVTAAKDEGLRVLAFMPRPDDVQAFIDAGADIIRLWEDWVTPERVKMIHNAGRECWIMSGKCTVEGVGHTDEAHMRLWLSLGVDGVLSNDVLWAKNILEG